jgi:hypothetical protein
MGFFDPDRYFASTASIDIRRDLLDCGLNYVLLDIDNTVVSRATHDVPHEVAAWIARGRDAGIKFCFLSNNWHGHVYDFAREVDLPIVAKACKPLPHGYIMAMRKLGAKRSKTVAVGDQLLTDVIGAHAVGCAAYLVMPLVTQDLAHTVALRNIERALLGARRPEPVGAEMSSAVAQASVADALRSATPKSNSQIHDGYIQIK